MLLRAASALLRLRLYLPGLLRVGARTWVPNMAQASSCAVRAEALLVGGQRGDDSGRSKRGEALATKG